MRHRDKKTVVDALKDWKALREKVLAEGGENYERPVLVKFLDSGTFEVMERDIVEDEFYVLRKFKILRELNAEGKDLQDAIREADREKPNRRSSSGQKSGGQKSGQKPGQKSGQKSGQKRGGSSSGNRRGGRRRGRRTGKRSTGSKGGGESSGGSA